MPEKSGYDILHRLNPNLNFFSKKPQRHQLKVAAKGEIFLIPFGLLFFK